MDTNISCHTIPINNTHIQDAGLRVRGAVRVNPFSKTTEHAGDTYKWTALIVASLGTLLGVLNASTLIIALPTMMVKLNT